MAILADGTISAVEEKIFIVTGEDFRTDVLDFTKVEINKITMFNNIQTQQTVILSIRKKDGDLRNLQQYQLKINETAEYLDAGEILPLEVGDEIQGETTTADAVDFVIYGTLL